jgi:hypothetical protein
MTQVPDKVLASDSISFALFPGRRSAVYVVSRRHASGIPKRSCDTHVHLRDAALDDLQPLNMYLSPRWTLLCLQGLKCHRPLGLEVR